MMGVEPEVTDGIKVRATQPGFYRQYRNVDDEFMIADEQAFSSQWMVKVGEELASPAVDGQNGPEAQDAEEKTKKATKKKAD